MRIAAWNCRSGALTKWRALEAAGVDLGVLCETSLKNPEHTLSLTTDPLHWVATGLPNKAVAIASRSTLRPLQSRPGEGRFCVGAATDSGPAVLGIYSNPETGGGQAYEEEVLACLTSWADELVTGAMIVAGDLNIGHAPGRTVPNAWVSRAHALWEELGLVSAYHSFFGEDITSPTRATHYWTYNVDHGWHIDYVLIHRSRIEQLRAVSVGGYDDWTAVGAHARSDLVPVFVDLDW